jgi:hypothetical protein
MIIQEIKEIDSQMNDLGAPSVENAGTVKDITFDTGLEEAEAPIEDKIEFDLTTTLVRVTLINGTHLSCILEKDSGKKKLTAIFGGGFKLIGTPYIEVDLGVSFYKMKYISYINKNMLL